MDQPRLPGMPSPVSVRPAPPQTTRVSLELKLYPPAAGDASWTLLSTESGPGYCRVDALTWPGNRTPQQIATATARFISETWDDLAPF